MNKKRDISKKEIKKCNQCIWYNGDCNDETAFCDDKEDFVRGSSYCYRFREDEIRI